MKARTEVVRSPNIMEVPINNTLPIDSKAWRATLCIMTNSVPQCFTTKLDSHYLD